MANARQPRRGAAATFIEKRLRCGVVSFALTELCEATGLSRIAAQRQLTRLGDSVTRVAPRQDFYLAVRPEHRIYGAPPVSWWLDAYFKWLKAPYYLALQSAAAEYGSRHQAIQTVQVMTDKPRRRIVLGRTRIHFFCKARLNRTPIQHASGAHALLRVSTPESTALDLVKYAGRIGGIERAIETLKPLIPKFQKKLMLAAIKANAQTANAQRFGYILDKLGYDRLAKAVEAHLPESLFRVALSAHSKTARRSEYSERWKVIAIASFENFQ